MLDQVTQHLSGARITDVSHIDSDITLVLGEVRLWMTTPWRIERQRAVVVGNDKLVEQLSHEDYRDDYDESLELVRAEVCGATIVAVRFGDLDEPVLELSNGCIFRGFQSYGDGAENFQLYVDGGRYLVYPGRVEHEPVC